MKLCRIGKKGKEKPALIDSENNYRDLSSVIKDLDSSKLNDYEFWINLNSSSGQFTEVISDSIKFENDINSEQMKDFCSTLTDEETELTADLLKSLSGENTVIVIDHDMEFIRRLDSNVTVLNQGSVLCEGTMDQIQNNPEVIEVYLGKGVDL